MDVVSEIKDKLNIIDVISPYSMLRKRGSNWFGLCPFHNEKTASFSVNEERGFYHCFGCGESGDIFSFVEKLEHTDFKGALEILAKQANVDISKSILDNKYNEKKNKLIEINELAQKFFSWILKENSTGNRGRVYVKSRGITQESIDEYQIGYAPTGFDNLYKMLVKKGYTDQDIIDSGVCIRTQKGDKIIDKFRGRLMFPIQNISGNVVGFSGRHIPLKNPKFEPPKYLNTGETTIFNKGKILYGFNQAKEEIVQKGYVILSEGQMNIISSYQVNVKNIVASMGTALTPEQLKLISRYTKNLYFCFDNDKAGQAALVRGIKLALNQDFALRVVILREGSDPDEEIKKDSDRWILDVDEAEDALDFIIKEYKKQYHSIDDKRVVLQNFVEIFTSCINPITRDVLVQKLSSEFNLSEETLLEYFAQKSDVKIIPKVVKESPVPSKEIESNDIEEYVLALICQNYDNLKEYLSLEHRPYFENNKIIFEKLLSDDLEKIIEEPEIGKYIEELLTKNLPNNEDVVSTFLDCLKLMKIKHVKKQVLILKERLVASDEDEQDTILREIENLTRNLS
ncbi:MAG: DNA primase [bacterium]